MAASELYINLSTIKKIRKEVAVRTGRFISDPLG